MSITNIHQEPVTALFSAASEMLGSFALTQGVDPSTYTLWTLYVPAGGFLASFFSLPVLLILGVLPLLSMLAYLVTLALQVSSPFATTYFAAQMTGNNAMMASALYAWTMPWRIKEQLVADAFPFLTTMVP